MTTAIEQLEPLERSIAEVRKLLTELNHGDLQSLALLACSSEASRTPKPSRSN